MENEAYNVLLTDEQRLILKTRKIRENIVDSYIENKGVPEKSSDIRVINEVLNSIDSNVTGVAELRLKHEENKQSEDMSEAIVEVFRQLSDKPKLEVNIENKRLDDKYIPDDIVPGEDVIEYQELNPDEIMKEKDK